MDSWIISFSLNCIMQYKQFYNKATKVSCRKSATTFGDLPDWLVYWTFLCTEYADWIMRLLIWWRVVQNEMIKALIKHLNVFWYAVVLVTLSFYHDVQCDHVNISGSPVLNKISLLTITNTLRTDRMVGILLINTFSNAFLENVAVCSGLNSTEVFLNVQNKYKALSVYDDLNDWCICISSL